MLTALQVAGDALRHAAAELRADNDVVWVAFMQLSQQKEAVADRSKALAEENARLQQQLVSLAIEKAALGGERDRAVSELLACREAARQSKVSSWLHVWNVPSAATRPGGGAGAGAGAGAHAGAGAGAGVGALDGGAGGAAVVVVEMATCPPQYEPVARKDKWVRHRIHCGKRFRRRPLSCQAGAANGGTTWELRRQEEGSNERGSLHVHLGRCTCAIIVMPSTDSYATSPPHSSDRILGEYQW